MPSTCEFKINRPNGVYFAGQSVSGSIVLTTTSEKNIRSIRIRFLGEAKVFWRETRRRGKFIGKDASLCYRGQEAYVDKGATVRDEGILPAGSYIFKYNFQIPKSCPTSCAGKYGHIRYALWLIVDRSLRFNKTYSRPLTVLKKVNLNLNPKFKVPLRTEEFSSVGCWPCAGGKFRYTLKVPFGAYASGQTLRYSLKIENQSMNEISGYKVEFVQWITFIAKNPHYKERKKRTVVANKLHLDSCLRLSNRQFEGKLVLPSLPPDSGCHGIIRLKHSLNLEIIVKGWHRNTAISVPIFIGNVPIIQSLQLHSQQEVTSTTTTSNVNPTTPLAPITVLEVNDDMDEPPSYGDLLPPSFEEAMTTSPIFLDQDDIESCTATVFLPLYPMYPEKSEC